MSNPLLDLGATERALRRYERAWHAASEGHGSETWATVAAAECANQVRGLLERAERLQAVEARLRSLHRPVDTAEDDATQRCFTCIAGYDPATGKLINVMWPCATMQALDAPVPLVPEWEREFLAEQARGGTNG